MVKSFEDVAFKLAPNEVSGIVETQFGYHLIKVLEHQAESNPPYDEVQPAGPTKTGTLCRDAS